jgi:hypothetical protein
MLCCWLSVITSYYGLHIIDLLNILNIVYHWKFESVDLSAGLERPHLF